MRPKILYVVLSVAVLAVVYETGPHPSRPFFENTMPVVPATAALEHYIQRNEQRHHLKPDNQARIVWADSTHTRTPYSIVYLHGFSASYKEGDPVCQWLAKNFHANLFLSRLTDHGIDTAEPLLQMTPKRLWASAREALAIGKQIGNQVILVSTSTGGTLALMLAAQYPRDVFALINLSPNIRINDPFAFLLNDPWGLQIARVIKRSKYNIITHYTPEQEKYWYARYRLEALTELEELVEATMNENTFHKVRQPSLTLYYYKNEKEQDPVVSIKAILWMHQQLGTPDSLKIARAIPNAGSHVIGSALLSKDYQTVYTLMEGFAIRQLHMKKVPLR